MKDFFKTIWYGIWPWRKSAIVHALWKKPPEGRLYRLEPCPHVDFAELLGQPDREDVI